MVAALHSSGGECLQDSAYRWWPKTRASESRQGAGAANVSGELCRYYLECLSRESGSGISIPRPRESADYVGLDELPSRNGPHPAGDRSRRQEDRAKAAGSAASYALHRLRGSPATSDAATRRSADRAGAALSDRGDAGGSAEMLRPASGIPLFNLEVLKSCLRSTAGT